MPRLSALLLPLTLTAALAGTAAATAAPTATPIRVVNDLPVPITLSNPTHSTFGWDQAPAGKLPYDADGVIKPKEFADLLVYPVGSGCAPFGAQYGFRVATGQGEPTTVSFGIWGKIIKNRHRCKKAPQPKYVHRYFTLRAWTPMTAGFSLFKSGPVVTRTLRYTAADGTPDRVATVTASNKWSGGTPMVARVTVSPQD